ncbi:unnamed protein product, partial [Didymodactylos carnosus]
TVSSGKSALVHRFLTGTYMQEESPEGGRFKKEIVIDNQSFLFLIRDEGSAPDTQFTHWVDAVIFVFSLENEDSFKTVYQYYTKMNHYRNTSDMPFVLVGTQDAISESNPRCIHEERARKLSNELKRCSYYETCATYGLNVERVFNDACQKVIQQRYSSLIPPSIASHRSLTPQASFLNSSSGTTNTNTTTSSASLSNSCPTHHFQQQSQSQSQRLTTNNQSVPTSYIVGNSLAQTAPASVFSSYHYQQHQGQGQEIPAGIGGQPIMAVAQLAQCINNAMGPSNGVKDRSTILPSSALQLDKRSRSFKEPAKLSTLSEQQSLQSQHQQQTGLLNEPLTPSSTPTQKRKETKRKSNLFTPGKKDDDKNKADRVGHGRAIPIKQGLLYKKGTNSINREWKKKYVVLLDDGRLIYHPSINDYEHDVHGKEIILQRTTIKIPGTNKPRVALRSTSNDTKLNDLSDAVVISNSNVTPGLNGVDNLVSSPIGAKVETPNAKKRHRRMLKSTHSNSKQQQGQESSASSIMSSLTNTPSGNGMHSKTPLEDDGEENEFILISIDKQWHFEASTQEERDEWVQSIEQQILFSLQNIESSKAQRAAKSGGGQSQLADQAMIQVIKQMPGNSTCADCDQTNPNWASLNLGALICMDCASLHRNLGTHLSRVRSLELDEWPPELMHVMRSIGNKMVNSVWEANTRQRQKPLPNASLSERERWIRDKYEQKLFLPLLSPSNPPTSLFRQLIDAINRMDLFTIILILAHHQKVEDLNNLDKRVPITTPMHLAATNGNVTILQLLLWYGADPFPLDSSGRTPLQCAYMSNNVECVNVLQQLTNNNSNTSSNINSNNNNNNNNNNSFLSDQTAISHHNNTLPRRPVQQQQSAHCGGQSSSTVVGPPYDKLPSTVI